MKNKIKYIDKYTYNNHIGELLSSNFTKEANEQKVALVLIQLHRARVIYTNWFYFKSVYPDQKYYKKSSINIIL